MNKDDLAPQENEHACSSAVSMLERIEVTLGKRLEIVRQAPRNSENIS